MVAIYGVASSTVAGLSAEDAHLDPGSVARRGDLPRVCPACVIVVGQDADGLYATGRKLMCVLLAPPLGAARVRCGREPKLLEVFDVLLAFDDQ